ncbi:unnamed protein product [Sphenostylis stenocarpa]|uniref:Uncharacterized protein n=1 Tax=Sphenostylis stenocarpa TaxID=92480 RepID=A0AA86V9M1_9FABA|nr:unnamed protein product [Sphenostylis stenocarpa]
MNPHCPTAGLWRIVYTLPFKDPLLSKSKEIRAHMMWHGNEATLPNVYAQSGSVSQANSVFGAMLAKNCLSRSASIAFPNSVAMISVLQASGGLAALEHGKLICGYILRRGLDSTLSFLSTLKQHMEDVVRFGWNRSVLN